MTTVDYILKEAVVIGAGISGLAVKFDLIHNNKNEKLIKKKLSKNR
jgi:hypothetical protein